MQRDNILTSLVNMDVKIVNLVKRLITRARMVVTIVSCIPTPMLPGRISVPIVWLVNMALEANHIPTRTRASHVHLVNTMVPRGKHVLSVQPANIKIRRAKADVKTVPLGIITLVQEIPDVLEVVAMYYPGVVRAAIVPVIVIGEYPMEAVLPFTMMGCTSGIVTTVALIMFWEIAMLAAKTGSG